LLASRHPHHQIFLQSNAQYQQTAVHHPNLNPQIFPIILLLQTTYFDIIGLCQCTFCMARKGGVKP
jgi:hypothetical protein